MLLASPDRLAVVNRLKREWEEKKRDRGLGVSPHDTSPQPDARLVSSNSSPTVITRKRSSESLSGLIRLYPYQQRWLQDKSRFRISCKGRQEGYSFVMGLEGALVASATRRPQIYLSRGERQSKLLAEKASSLAKALDVASSPVEESEWVSEDKKVQCLQLEIRYPNGNKMYFLPAKPETARSYSGDVYLDEFAMHQDASAIYRALYPTVTRGYRVSIVSTPNGQIGKYYEFAKSAGMVKGYDRDPYCVWSAHYTDIYLAVMEGLAEGHRPDPTMKIHPDIEAEIMAGFQVRGHNPSPLQYRFVCELRAGAEDPDLWPQEFECEFLSASQNYIPIDLILDAEKDDIGTEDLPEFPLEGRTFLGIDIGRKVHRTVFWLQEEITNTADLSTLLVTRAMIVIKNKPFQDQMAVARNLMQRCNVYKCAIDATGMGAQIAEDLEREFPGRVEQIQFTLQSKDMLATLMKRTFEEHRYRIPASPIIRADINGIKRSVTRAGNIIFSAEETKEGHSDRAWGLALSTYAAQQPTVVPLGRDDFIGLDRPMRAVTGAPNWESRDLRSLWGPMSGRIN